MKKLTFLVLLCGVLLMTSCALTNILSNKKEKPETSDPEKDVVLREPDFSQMSSEEIEAYLKGDLSDALELADVRYLSDAVFFEENASVSEVSIDGIDFSDWKEPGLYHPDFDALLGEYEEDETGDDTPGDPFGDADSLPERYAKLIPGTILENAQVIRMDSTFLLNGSADKSDYQKAVNAFKNAGYTTITERDIAGALFYSAMGSDDMVSITFADGAVSISITQ